MTEQERKRIERLRKTGQALIEKIKNKEVCYEAGFKAGKQEAQKMFKDAVEKAYYSPKLDHKRTEEVNIFRKELLKVLEEK